MEGEQSFKKALSRKLKSVSKGSKGCLNIAKKGSKRVLMELMEGFKGEQNKRFNKASFWVTLRRGKKFLNF